MADKASRNDQSPPNEDGDNISDSIQALLEFYSREEQSLTQSQRFVERANLLLSHPLYPLAILLFVGAWLFANAVLGSFHLNEFDPPPYFWLQGFLGLGSLLTATAVLSRQYRLGKVAAQREYLELKISLLTEQKTAKLIELVEELRRDLPNVKNRHDPSAVALGEPVSATMVREALAERPRLEEQARAAMNAESPPAASK